MRTKTNALISEIWGIESPEIEIETLISLSILSGQHTVVYAFVDATLMKVNNKR